MKWFVIAFVVLLLISCVPLEGARPRQADQEAIAAQLDRLPGVLVQRQNGLQFSYPEQSMFGAGAVLPLPGGTGLLDPLAEFLLRNAGLVWQVDVQAHTGHGAVYDQTLAEKRSELLASYLLSKGVELNFLNFQPTAAEEDLLIFTLLQPQEAANR